MATATTVTKVTKPTTKPPAKPAALDLLQQYENKLSGVGRGTEGNPNRDFQTASELYWQSTGNQRTYADQLRGESRAHEKNMLGMEISGQTATAQIGANASKYAAKTGADASKFGAQVGADTEKYLARLGLQGTQAQTKGRVDEANIGARAQRDVAGLQAGAQKYMSDNDARVSLAGQGSAERQTKMTIEGDNYRSGLQLAGSLLTNKADNETQRQGKFFDYMGNVANAQWRAPDTSNIRYWGG